MKNTIRIVSLIMVALITVFACGCKKNSDTDSEYSTYTIIDGKKVTASDKKDEKTEKTDSSSSKTTSDKKSNSPESKTSSEEDDDFMTGIKIDKYKESNAELNAKVKTYQDALKKLGSSYPAVSLPKQSGKTQQAEYTYLKSYNETISKYAASLKSLLITKGRASVKKGVTGDINAAYAWAKAAFSKEDNLVALTFDDVPSSYTADLLDGLKARNAVAVFFVIGNRVNSSNSALLKRMANEGHIIGNHSMNHIPLYHKYIDENTHSLLDPVKEITDCTNVIKNATDGYNPFLLRVPGLIYAKSGTAVKNNTYDAKTLSTNQNMMLVDAQYGFDDAADGTTCAELEAKIRPGSIVLLHATQDYSPKAALEFIDKKKPDGYTFVTVPELLMAYNGSISLGVAYKSFNAYANLG